MPFILPEPDPTIKTQNQYEYNTWQNMKDRCLNIKSRAYKHYGGRGITIHEPWIKSYDKFIEDVGHKPGSNYSLDRINNNGNYEPGNVRWATVHTQAANRRNNNPIVGIYKLKNRWYAMLCVDKVFVLFKAYKTLGEAMDARAEAKHIYKIK